MAVDPEARHPSKPRTKSSHCGLPIDQLCNTAVSFSTLYVSVLLFIISLFAQYEVMYEYGSKYDTAKLKPALKKNKTLTCRLAHRHVTVHVQ